MWTMSNSRAEPRPVAFAAALVLLMGCSGQDAPAQSPDSPRPARDGASLAQTAPSSDTPLTQDRPVELRSVRVLAVRGDSMLERLAGATMLQEARSPLAVEVVTIDSLGDVWRSASPEVYLNGVRVGDTWPLPPDRLLVFLPDAGGLRAPVQVTVAWLGREERTRSTEPLVITEEQLRPFR